MTPYPLSARRIFLWVALAGICFASGFAGCGKAARTSPAGSLDQTAGDLQHTVKWQGETLSAIAQWYTGSSDSWTAIAKANPAIKPNRILLGDTIIIPAGLVKKRQPLPENFLRKFHKKMKADPKPASEKPAPDNATEAPDLFGPKTAPPPQTSITWPGKPETAIAPNCGRQVRTVL